MGVLGIGGRRRKPLLDDPDGPGGSQDGVIPSLSGLARIRRVCEDYIEDYDGSKYAVWQIAGCDVLDGQAVNGWMRVLNSIEYPVQVLIRQHSPDYSDIRHSLLEARPEAMRTGWINDVGNSMLVYLHELEEGELVVSRAWYVIARYERAVEFTSMLAQAGFEGTRLEEEALGLLVQACMSGMGVGHTQDLYQLKEQPNDLELNYRYMSVYEVHKWPRRVSFLFLEQLLRTGEEMDLSFWIWPVSQRESHSRLQMQRSRFEGARLVSEHKGKLVQPEVELAIGDIVRIADGVERGISRLFRRTLVVAVYGRDRKHLREVEEKLTGHFRSSLAGVRQLKFRQGKGYAAVMPLLRRAPGEMDLTDSETMLRLFPFGPKDMDKREGTLLGMDLRSRTTVFTDPFSPDAMNGHMVVMARSGAGKSFFTKLRVLREALRGIPVYLIDPEGEYGVITRALGGEVFVPGSPGYGLNPFVLGYTEEGDLTKRVSSLCSLIGVMLEGDVSQDLKAVIDRCLTGFYAKELRESYGHRLLGGGGMNAFHEYLESEEAQEFGGDRLSHVLSSFATGSARFLMRGDARDLLEHEVPVTSFNLKNLSSRLKPVATSICAEVVWGLAVTNPRPRLLVVDECWTVLSTPSGAESLLTIVKRARKYQLGLMTITQDVQDFLAENQGAGLITGHAGRSLLQNSAMKLAFQQDPAALPQVTEALGLNSDVSEFLSASLRGQGVLVGERGDCYPLEIVSTPEEREILLDRSWLTDGQATGEDAPGHDLVPNPDAALDEEARNKEGLADDLMRRLAAEREADAVAAD